MRERLSESAVFSPEAVPRTLGLGLTKGAANASEKMRHGAQEAVSYNQGRVDVVSGRAGSTESSVMPSKYHTKYNS